MFSLDKLPKEHIFQESDSYTCGPCCLAMVYAFKKKKISLKDILNDFHHPEKGKPTYVSQLGRHLNSNDIKTKILVSSSKLLSPAWKNYSREELITTLKEWLILHPKADLFQDVLQILFYLQEGGSVEPVSYTVQTIKDMLDRNSMVILCVDDHWIWGHRFTFDKTKTKKVIDDLEGEVGGHFVLVTKYIGNTFHVLDPFPTHIEGRHGEYDIDVNDLLNASLTWEPQIIEILDK
jgi:hypothetical protein